MENRRNTLVINKDFQHHYALVLVAMTILLSNLFIIFSMLFPGEHSFSLTATSAVSLGVIELVLVAGVWFAGIRASHRIAGPMYVITRELAEVGSGNLAARVHLRDKDMFRAEAESVNASLEALCDRIDAIQVAARELQAAHAAGADTGARLDDLLGRIGQLRTRSEG